MSRHFICYFRSLESSRRMASLRCNLWRELKKTIYSLATRIAIVATAFAVRVRASPVSQMIFRLVPLTVSYFARDLMRVPSQNSRRACVHAHAPATSKILSRISAERYDNKRTAVSNKAIRCMIYMGCLYTRQLAILSEPFKFHGDAGNKLLHFRRHRREINRL